jgi:hypothetical protein
MESCPTCGQGFTNPRLHWGNSACPVPESKYYDCKHDGCDERFKKTIAKTKHEEHHPKHRDSGKICHDCQHKYDRISAHWSGSDHCEYPKLTDEQHDIIVGLMMGDGCAAYNEKHKNPNIRVNCIKPEYLHYLSDKFGVLGNDVFLGKTGDEKAAENRERGFRPDANGDDYSDQYGFTTMSTPEMWEYRHWYDSGEKVWPESIELNPLTLTHWFCGDGNNQFDYPSVRLSMNNERDNRDKVESYFERVGLPTPDRWGINDVSCNAAWNKESSEELFEYMEGPVAGYEYKWPDSVK